MSNDTKLDLTCSICLCDIDDISKNIIKTECCHIFHSNCFLKNVAYNGFNCPNCRTILYDDNNEDNYSDEDEYYSDEEEDEYDEEDYENEENERIRLNGSRWLFMRAEGLEIHPDDNDEYDYDDEYDEEYNNENEEDDEDEDYEDEEDEEDYEENERIKLNGFRWLFMRAEGIEIHRFDNDEYEFDENDYNYEDYNLENNIQNNNEYNIEDNYPFGREPALSGVNISINDIAEKIIQKGVTYKELLVLIIGFNIHNASDVAEYGKRQLNEIEQMIYDISDGISN